MLKAHAEVTKDTDKYQTVIQKLIVLSFSMVYGVFTVQFQFFFPN